MTGPVRCELASGLLTLTLAEAESRNAFSAELVGSLNEALRQAADEPEARVGLLLAEGPAFSAGMDMKRVALDDRAQAARFADALAEAYRRLLRLPIPLLCAVDGPAMGGAVGLALSADLIWMGPNGRFSFPETRVGVVPALVSVPARRRLPVGRLSGLALSGALLEPDDARRIGMVDFIAAESAAAEARAFAANMIRERSDEAMRRTKAFLQAEGLADLDRQLEAARLEFCQAVQTAAARRGVEAFRRKQPLVWDESGTDPS